MDTEWGDTVLPVTDGVECGGESARFARLPWFSYHSADAVPMEGTVL